MLIILLFIIVPEWRQPQCPSTDKQINKIWYSLTVEYNSAVKRDGVLPHEFQKHAKWQKPVTKTTYCMISFMWNLPVQFSSVTQSCPTLWDPMNHSTPGLPVHHQLLEFTQTHVHRVSDAIQPSHPLSSPSPPAPNPSQHQGLFQWINTLHEVAKVLEFQLQHQSFQWTPRTDLL